MLDKATKNDFIANKYEEDKDQAFIREMDGEKCRRMSEDMNLSMFSISKSVRLQRKFRF